MSEPRLSVLMVTGSRRERVSRQLEALSEQTVADEIELILLDLGPPTDAIEPPANLRMTRLSQPATGAWGSIRAAGVRAARAPVIAFLEDHCVPSRVWAEMLLEAHERSSWAAVGYAFLAGSRRWKERTARIAEYGPWAHPAVGGRTRILPGNNISYKREPLVDLAQLDDALLIDNTVHREFEARGLEGAIEPRALVRHLELSRLWDVARANYCYGRLLAVGLARAESWGPVRRLLFAIAVPVGTPVSRLRLLAKPSSRGGLGWTQFAALLPGAALVWLLSGVGQALGCLAGPGDSERRLIAWEVEAAREGDSVPARREVIPATA